MPSLAALGRRELVERLRGRGLRLHTGPFLTCISSSLDALPDQLLAMYGDYPVEDGAALADFHVRLAAGGGLRRWIKPQVIFHYDGLEPFEPLPLAQTFPMLEWGLNWCVTSHAQSWLVIHAAVVELGGGAVILPAPSGSGKSTLCAALVSRGWRLLSDELTLVRLSDGRIEPNPRPVSLKNQSIDIMRSFAPGETYTAPVRDTVKGTVAHMRVPGASVARAAEAADPAFVIFPRYQAGAAASLVPVPPARAFFRLAEHAFNYSALGRAGFDCVAALTGATRAFDFTYSSLDEAIALFERLMAERP